MRRYCVECNKKIFGERILCEECEELGRIAPEDREEEMTWKPLF